MKLFLKRFFIQLIHYLLFTRNSFFQILYLLLLTTFHAIPIQKGLATMRLVEPHSYHLLMPFLFCSVNLFFFFVCSFSDPGVITKHNILKYLNKYPYDGFLYKPYYTCPTCNLERPARSKHCVVMNKCIYKFDHYCVWVANTIGGKNHHYFILFLTTLFLMLLNGTIKLWRVLNALGSLTKLWVYAGLKMSSDPDVHTWLKSFYRYTNYFELLTRYHTSVVFIFCACFVFTIGLCGFAIYHWALMLLNLTTNEIIKRRRFKKDHKKYLTLQERKYFLDVTNLMSFNFYHIGFINNLKDSLTDKSLCIYQNVLASKTLSWNEALGSPMWKMIQERKNNNKNK